MVVEYRDDTPFTGDNHTSFHKQEVEIDKINDSLRRHDLKLVEHETEIHALKEDTNALYNADRTLNR